MITNQDVVIVGGGAVGAACARELTAVGHSVRVLDPGQRLGSAWQASAGMLAPQIDAWEDNPLFELGIAGREYYRDKAAELRDQTGVDIELFDGGILRLARGEAEINRLKSSVAWQRQLGHHPDWLDPAEVRDQFPWAGESEGALWAPHDGSVNPVRLVDAFRKSAQHQGAVFETDLAVGLEIEADRVIGVRAERQSYSAGAVVLAAGAWTGRLEGLPRPLSVEPVRGQMIAKRWPGSVPPGIVYGPDGYVVERGGEALCGATMEHAGFDARVTAAGERSILEATNALLPALAPLQVDRRWAGLRPVTPDGLPIFGAEPKVANLWYATGYGRNGVLLAGITAVALCHLMAKEASFEGIEALRPERFWSW